MKHTPSTCCYCGVGCGVIIESDQARIVAVRGDPNHPANFGRLCSKGSTLHLTAAPHITQQSRLLEPQVRPERGGPLQAVTWDSALELAADRLAHIIDRDGPDAIGLYLSGQLLTEDYYVFNKLGKGLIGTNNVDTNSRLCMSSAVAGYKATLGSDAPPNCYEDLALAQTVFIAGSNTAWAHPVLFRRLEDARRANPGQRWIVVDPRRTETAAVADLHLALLPGSDVALFHGLLHLMLWEGLTDPAFIAAHTSGFDALRDRVRDFTPKHVAQLCGLKEDDIVQAARWFSGQDAASPTSPRTPTLSLYCQGLNQSSSGTDKNAALINLHLATGQIGKPGAGPFSLTGQPNAMGGREVGGLANLLSAHRDLANPAHRAEVAALWGIKDVPALPGKAAIEMFEAAADGALKALWIVCTNPAQSLPDQAMVRRALQRCDFVVLQEAFATTATAPYADLLLPATTWGEKEGTVTNSERRISRVRAAVPAPGQARDDWAIAVDLARRLEARLPQRRADGQTLGQTLFPYEHVEEVWNEHRESTRGRDLDITGLSYALLEAAPQQWPCPEGQSHGKARLYEDGQFPTPDGRARFAAPVWRATAEVRDARYPFSLTTGRLRDQWHGMSRTGLLGRLFGHAAEPCIELHPQELSRRQWRAGDLLRVQSRRGEVVLPVQPSESVPLTQAFIGMHWGEEFVSGHDADGAALLGVNALTTTARCPQSKQPEFKHAAVRLERAELAWHLVAGAWLPEAELQTLRGHLRALMPRWAYASCVPFGREPDGRVGLLLRCAASSMDSDEILHHIESLLTLSGDSVLRYRDARRGQRRAMRLAFDANPAHAHLEAFMLAGDASAATWVLDLLQEGVPARPFGQALLSGQPTPPRAMPTRTAQLCNCFDVSRAEVINVLSSCRGDEETQLAQVQSTLRCGTQCGSCLPALRALVKQSNAAQGVATSSP